MNRRTPEVNYRAQKYAACQLIAAINARIYLDSQDVSDEEFERLVDVARCRHGSALKMQDVIPQLGLTRRDGAFSLDWISAHLPVAISTHEIEHHGLHQILVVGVTGKVLEVVNFYKPRLSWQELVEIQPAEQVRQCISYSLAAKAA